MFSPPESNTNGAWSQARSVFQQIQQNIASFHPKLHNGFLDLVSLLGGPDLLGVDNLETIRRLVLGTEYIYLDHSIVNLAWMRGELADFSAVIVRMHETGPASAAAFARMYPSLQDPLAQIRLALLEYAAKVPALDAKAQLLSWAFALPGCEDRREALTGFADLASTIPASLVTVGQTLEGNFRQRPTEELRVWLARGFRLMRGGRVEEASAYLCLQSRESRAFLGMSGAFLREEQGILRIYADSHCSRSLNILTPDVSAFMISRPYTDGKSLFLPAQISIFPGSAHNRRAYSALTAMLAGTITLGSFSFDQKKLACRYELADRYGSLLPEYYTNLRKEFGSRLKSIRERAGNLLEVVLTNKRSLIVLESPMEKFFYSFPSPHFIKLIFCLVEATRIEASLARRYEGLSRDFRLINEHAFRRLAPVDSSVTGRKRVFLEAVRYLHGLRLGLSLSKTGEPGGKVQEEIREIFSEVRAQGAVVEDSAQLAFRIYNVFFDAFPLSNFADDLSGGSPWSHPLELGFEFAVVAAQSPELIAWPEEREKFAGEDAERIQDVDFSSVAGRDGSAKASSLRDEIRSRSVRLFRYPEFDEAKASYLPRHCLLYERELEPGPPDWFERILLSRQQLSSVIVKKFQAMQPEEVELTRRWAEGDEIHIGDALDYTTDLLRGDSGDDRIYQRKTVNVRDIAVQILVDASSSTTAIVNDQSVLEIEKTALVILGSALHRIGDDFSIASFNSNGPQKISFYLAKDFSDPWTSQNRARIAGITANAANRDGCAIRHATARLRNLGNKTKLLLLLSDGIPADPEYGDSDGISTSLYALEDTRRAILECRRSGIVPYCLTIDTAAKSYIGHLYGDYHYSVLDNIESLPQRLARLYVRLTR